MGRFVGAPPQFEAEGGRNEEEERLDEDAGCLFELEAPTDELKSCLFVDNETPFELEMWRFELLQRPLEEEVCLSPRVPRRRQESHLHGVTVGGGGGAGWMAQLTSVLGAPGVPKKPGVHEASEACQLWKSVRKLGSQWLGKAIDAPSTSFAVDVYVNVSIVAVAVKRVRVLPEFLSTSEDVPAPQVTIVPGRSWFAAELLESAMRNAA
jgi:hypothetical protein